MVKNGNVQLLSRKHLTQAYATIVAQAKGINARGAMIDGEIATLEAKGRILFHAIDGALTPLQKREPIEITGRGKSCSPQITSFCRTRFAEGRGRMG